MQEIRGDSKTVVDWVNGLAKLKTPESTIATAQNLLWKWWNRGVDLHDWAVHIFRERNEEADVWSGKGAGGREEEWVNTANVVWSEVHAIPFEMLVSAIFSFTLKCWST